LIRIDNLLKNLSARQQAASLDNKTNKTTTKTADIANQSGITEDNQEWLETFEAFILSQLSDTTLSVPHIAKEFSMSESTLLRRLKQLTGLSTVQYLQEVRLNQARNLLEDQHYNSVAAVCQKVGYTNPSSFSRKYKNRFGKPPSAYF
jgi:AraC-like DNA-binding protein